MSEMQEEKQTVSGTISLTSSLSGRQPRSKLLPAMVSELLNVGYVVRFRANGTSMHPTIREGEIITVEPVNPSDVNLGDIILYQNHGGLTAHRVVSIRGAKEGFIVFTMRGDASGSCDAPVEWRHILGKVTAVERNGRKISLDGRTPKLFWMVRRNVSGIKRWFSQKATLIGLRHPRCARIRSVGVNASQAQPRTGCHGLSDVNRGKERQWCSGSYQ